LSTYRAFCVGTIVLGTFANFSCIPVHDAAAPVKRAAARPSDEPQEYHFDNGESSRAVPFEEIDNHIFVRGSIGGLGKAWFVLDTGASSSLVRTALAAPTFLDFLLGSPGVSFRLAITSSPIPNNWASSDGHALDVVLGCDFFQRFVVEVHYDENQISLYKPGDYQPSGQRAEIPITLTDSCPSVASVVTSKPANGGQGKTGQRRWPRT
jgi:hypothetical protein